MKGVTNDLIRDTGDGSAKYGIGMALEEKAAVGSTAAVGMLITRSRVEVRYGMPSSSTNMTASAIVFVSNCTSVTITRLISVQHSAGYFSSISGSAHLKDVR